MFRFTGRLSSQAMATQTERLIIKDGVFGIVRNPGGTRPRYGIEKSKNDKDERDKNKCVLHRRASFPIKGGSSSDAPYPY